MTEPASAAGSTSRGADGVAAPISTVDIELMCVKGERNKYPSRNSRASREVMGGKGESGEDRNRIDGSTRRSTMLLGKEILVDAGTEWRVKWAQRGIGTFVFLGVLCYIIGTSTSSNSIRVIAIVCGGQEDLFEVQSINNTLHSCGVFFLQQLLIK